MKKLLLLSFFIVSSTVMTSCTADAIPPSATIHADDTGGQGIPPPPPPKPPGTGTGKR